MRILLILSLVNVNIFAQDFNTNDTKDLKLKAEQGDAFAQCNIGSILHSGIGATKDQVEAVKWFKKAADQGLSYAQYMLGYSYYKGEGIPKDYSEAVKWFCKAAESGEPGSELAYGQLGICYYMGQGVQKDYVKAYAYSNLAGTTIEAGRKNCNSFELNMTPSQIAEGQKLSQEIQKKITAKLAEKNKPD